MTRLPDPADLGQRGGRRALGLRRDAAVYRARFPGPSVFRVPNVGQKGEAWNLDYAAGASPLVRFPEDDTGVVRLA